MRSLFWFMVFFFSICIKTLAQISSFGVPIVVASGGDGKNKVWVKPSKQQLEEMPGWIWGDCANSISDVPVIASSVLAPQGNATYGAKNLQDDDPTTAWVEGRPDYGIGEYFEGNISVTYHSLTIYNGYQKSPKAFIENSRVKSLMVSENGINRVVIRLKDEMGDQSVGIEELGLKNVNKGRNVKLRFTILEVYPGTKYKDVAISEIYQGACCIAGDAEMIMENESLVRLEELNNQTVKFIDANGQILNLRVGEVGSIVHRTMLKITASTGRAITVAPYHKIYANNIGNKLSASQLQIGDYVYTFIDGKLDSAKITSVETIKGETKSYYFKNIDLPAGQVQWPLKAIVNGFIVSDEYLDSRSKKQNK